MDPKTVVKELWQSYNRGNLDETWNTYIAEGIDVKVLEQVAEGDMVASRWVPDRAPDRRVHGRAITGPDGDRDRHLDRPRP